MAHNDLVFDGALTAADVVVLKNLEADIETRCMLEPKDALDDSEVSDGGTRVTTRAASVASNASTGITSISSSSSSKDLPAKKESLQNRKTTRRLDEQANLGNPESDVSRLKAVNDPLHAKFQPTVFLTIDDYADRLPASITKHILQPFIRWAKTITRHETDVVMITHLAIYFTTLVPSALLLFCHFTYTHGVLHTMLQLYYSGTYTLMMHQHIHQRGILNKKFDLFDRLFPYLLDPLMGHTWNGYYYHHVKHHHVEGNGPDDLSSTIRYQRDSAVDFLRYFGRFFLLVWLDLPRYFLRKGRPSMALQAGASETLSYFFYYAMTKVVGTRPTVFVYLLPLLIMRIGLMVGNWGQHAFVDPDEPDSDHRSSITLIDVASNRFCFNDGYHTSHHLNPLRHWRDHPVSFLEQKRIYADEGALVFHNIDFLMITVRLLRKDYAHLAKCLVPMGSQIDLTLDQRAHLLKRLTRKFTEQQIVQTFPRRA